jgi:putative intracellular protease/amidase
MHAEKDMDLLKNSVPIAGLKADDFDAIYIPGGHGIAVDGPFDLTLRKLISDFAAQGKLVSAVCHGPVAFSGTAVDGKPIVAGKRASGPLGCCACSAHKLQQP